METKLGGMRMGKCRFGLTGNQLKLLALISMTLDHIGLMFEWLPPETRLLLRIAGRLAFPIFAFMIAEGCRHTRDMRRYFTTLAVCGVVCQGVYLVFLKSFYMCVFVTFSLSVGLIWLVRIAKSRKTPFWYGAFFAGVLAAFFLAEILPELLPGTDYGIDYDFIGIMIPVCVYLCWGKWMQLAVCGVLLALLASYSFDPQKYSLLALPLLALYNGKRGKWKLKWLFYFYYPAHLVFLWTLAMLKWRGVW